MKVQNLILTFLLFGLISCNSTDSIFTDETYQDTIKQNIGGLLIRNIHHYNDFNSFSYDIDYSYKDISDSISKIGLGSFYGQEPPKEEQLIQIDNWTVFKTSGDREKDFVYINNCDNIWTKYEISPETIEQQDLWKEQKIDSQIDNWDTVSKIKEIDKNGNIVVIYTYAKKKRIFSFFTGKRQITYNIDLQTGIPEMTEISEI